MGNRGAHTDHDEDVCCAVRSLEAKVGQRLSMRARWRTNNAGVGDACIKCIYVYIDAHLSRAEAYIYNNTV